MNRQTGRIGRHRYPIVERMIAEGKTAGEIADHLGIFCETVRKYARRRGLTIQRHDQSLDKHPSWRGGTTLDRQGYELRRVEVSGPYGYLIRALREGDARGYAPTHRIVMHDKLGRDLEPGEVVHHIDGNIRNNDPDNLDLYPSNGEHLAETLKGKRPNWTPEGYARIGRKQPKSDRQTDRAP